MLGSNFSFQIKPYFTDVVVTVTAAIQCGNNSGEIELNLPYTSIYLSWYYPILKHLAFFSNKRLKIYKRNAGDANFKYCWKLQN